MGTGTVGTSTVDKPVDKLCISCGLVCGFLEDNPVHNPVDKLWTLCGTKLIDDLADGRR